MNLNLNAFFKIIGLILMVIGLSMLPSFFVSLIYDDASVYVPFLITLTVSSAVGIFLFKICKKSSKSSQNQRQSNNNYNVSDALCDTWRNSFYC